MACTCDGWEKGYPEFDKFIMLGFSHGIFWQGGVWEFCPWCGKRINNPPVPVNSNIDSVYDPYDCIHEYGEPTTLGQVFCRKCGSAKWE